MKNLKSIAFAGCSVLLLCQCASVDEVRRLNYQLRTVNKKVKDVESNAADQALKGTALSASQLDSMAEETRELRTITQEKLEAVERNREEDAQKIEELQSALQQMLRENQTIRSESSQIRSESNQIRQENERLVGSLEDKINKLSSNVQRVSQARAQAAEKRARQAAQRAEQARKKAALAARSQTQYADNTTLLPDSKKVRKNYGEVVDTAPRRTRPEVNQVRQPLVNAARQHSPGQQSVRRQSGPNVVNAARQQIVQHPPEVVAARQPAPQAADRTEAGQFNQGVSRFKAKDYKAAYKIFEQVLAGRPEGDLAAKTLYFMGECLFNIGEYDLAILDYQKVISNYRKNPHSSAALLRQGMSFEKLTDNETSRIIYTKLISDYPNSREAGVARQRMENL
jgi:tol-pal system protein YbgF